MRVRFKVTTIAIALAMVTGTALVASAPSGASGTKSSGPSGSVTIGDDQGSLWACSFNPFNPNDAPYSVGPVYETLEFVDTLDNAKVTPWLATGSAWSNDDKTLTFTIRTGVKWSDGVPFTAADVLYTFDLLKKYPALDTNAVWSVLSSVSQVGDKVVFNFKSAAVPYFYYIADQVPIVPEHVLDKVANPVSWVDSKPIGTGAFTLQSCTPEDMKYTANLHYWQPDEPKIKTVNAPSFTSNTTANEYLADDQAQWGTEFIPSIKSYYLAKSPTNHDWFPAVSDTSLFPNLTVKPLNSLPVREAIAYGIDRTDVSNIGEQGMETPANQTDVETPTFDSWFDKSIETKANVNYNPAKAKKILKAAGYKMGSNGVFEKDGKQLSFTVIVVGDYSDYVADTQVIASELGNIGIKLTIDGLSGTAFNAALYTGKYQLAYTNEMGGPTPFYEMRQLLYSGNSAPIGSSAASNWERYSNPETDKLLDEYGTTTNTKLQHTITDELQQIMVSQIPVIPVVQNVDWTEYSTKDVTGFSTAKDPYAQPSAYMYPDWGIVLLHLKPNK